MARSCRFISSRHQEITHSRLMRFPASSRAARPYGACLGRFVCCPRICNLYENGQLASICCISCNNSCENYTLSRAPLEDFVAAQHENANGDQRSRNYTHEHSSYPGRLACRCNLRTTRKEYDPARLLLDREYACSAPAIVHEIGKLQHRANHDEACICRRKQITSEADHYC